MDGQVYACAEKSHGTDSEITRTFQHLPLFATSVACSRRISAGLIHENGIPACRSHRVSKQKPDVGDRA
jgi:hypothetical protein